MNKSQDFYGSIAPVYDELFPFQPKQRDFVLMTLKDLPRSATVLDVGCGTGSLIVPLAHHFEKTFGMDPDQDMLDHAWVKVLEEAVPTEFIPDGMLDITRNFSESSVDAILCLGNTLVHLPGTHEVQEMLTQAFQVLKPGGFLIIQIINYDRILDEGLQELPTIETSSLRFERHYNRTSDPSTLIFKTLLHDKANGNVHTYEVPLFAIRPGLLDDLLLNSGFIERKAFGSFDGTPFTLQSQPYIVTVRKPNL